MIRSEPLFRHDLSLVSCGLDLSLGLRADGILVMLRKPFRVVHRKYGSLGWLSANASLELG